MPRLLPTVVLLLALTALAVLAQGRAYIVAAGRSPIPAEGEHFTRPIPARRIGSPDDTRGHTTTTAPARVISWTRAGDFLNQTVTVEGTIIDTHDIGSLTFLNFTRERADNFYAIVFQEVYPTLPAPPERYYLRQKVRITGRVVMHRGRPQIRVRDAGQVEIVR